jgi:hypothetical protein
MLPRTRRIREFRRDEEIGGDREIDVPQSESAAKGAGFHFILASIVQFIAEDRRLRLALYSVSHLNDHRHYHSAPRTIHRKSDASHLKHNISLYP